MKKKTKIILVIAILFIIAIIAITFYIIMQYEKYTLTILEIDGSDIRAEEEETILYTFSAEDESMKNMNGQEITISELKVGDSVIVNAYADRICTIKSIENNEVTVAVPKYYHFSVENAKIKDINGNNINISNLQVGNVVEVTNKKDNSIDNNTDLASSIEYLSDVKQIKVIDDKIDEASNAVATLSAVVMEVHESGLSVMEIKEGESSYDLYTVSFAQEGNIGFKQGQEVLIYFDGIVAESFPAQIFNVSKIEITKEETDITIPDDVIRYYNNTTDKVKVDISELATTGVKITITDTNELSYEYSNNYVIYEKVKNENYTGKGYQIGEDTENSTSGYTGTGLEYIWEEMEKKSNAKIEDTIKDLTYNLPNMTENEHYTVIGKQIEWTEIYGELADGEYRLMFSNEGSFPINIEFEVKKGETELIGIEKVR